MLDPPPLALLKPSVSLDESLTTEPEPGTDDQPEDIDQLEDNVLDTSFHASQDPGNSTTE